MAPLSYKKNFRARPALQLFYSGGPLQLSPDASFIACACVEEVRIVELSTGAVVKSLPGDSELVTAISITPNGGSIFTASRSLQVKHWDLSTCTVRRSWKAHDGPVPDMAVDASGGLLATASADKSVRVWDTDGGFCTHAFRGHKGVVTRVAFHPDPHRLLLFSGGDDATVRVWDLVTKKCVAVLEKHFSTVTSLAFSTNGWTLLSGARDKVVNVWSLRDYSHEATVPVYEAVEAVHIVPNSCSLPGSAVVDDPSKKQKNEKPRFITVGDLGLIRVFSVDGAKCLYKQKLSDVALPSAKDDTRRGFVSAFMLPMEGLLCVTYDQRLLLYEPYQTPDGQRELRINKRLIGQNDEVTDLRFIGEHESMLAVATNAEQIRLYELETMACIHELTGHSDIVLCLDACLTKEGRAILASGGKDHTLRLWDVESGCCIGMAAGHMAAVGAVAFSKKHRNFLVTGSRDRTIKCWGLGSILDAGVPDAPLKMSSQAVVAAHDKDINSVAVAPNDSLVCSGSQDTTARVWKLPELTLVTTLRGHKRGVWSVEFSPVDQCVLTSSGDKTIRIWALSDGSCLKTFEGHNASVLKASFLSQGTQIISAGADGLLKLWTIKSNECINTFDQHNDRIWALAVAPGSESLASGGSDSTVILWKDCTEADEEEAAVKEAEEALKDQELSNALADTDYEKAVLLALELRRPFRLLGVFESLFKDGEDSQVHAILNNMDKEYLQLLLHYVREWNSKSKFSYVAQCVLQHLFNVFPPAEIVKVPGVSDLLEGILPYTQRHFSRIDRLARSCFILDYTLACMSVLTPVETDASAGINQQIFIPGSEVQPAGMRSFWSKQQTGMLGEDKKMQNVKLIAGSSSGKQHPARRPMKVLQQSSTTVQDDGAVGDKKQVALNNAGAEAEMSAEMEAELLADVEVTAAAEHEKKKKRKLRATVEANGEQDTDDLQLPMRKTATTKRTKSTKKVKTMTTKKKKKKSGSKVKAQRLSA